MLISMAAIVAGFVVIATGVFISFTIIGKAMGPDGVFAEGVFDATLAFVLTTSALSLLCAVGGGAVCRVIARRQKAAIVLAGIVLFFGLAEGAAKQVAFSIRDQPPARTAEMPWNELLTHAREPAWVSFANPFIGVMGVLIGASAFRS